MATASVAPPRNHSIVGLQRPASRPPCASAESRKATNLCAKLYLQIFNRSLCSQQALIIVFWLALFHHSFILPAPRAGWRLPACWTRVWQFEELASCEMAARRVFLRNKLADGYQKNNGLLARRTDFFFFFFVISLLRTVYICIWLCLSARADLCAR